MTLTVKQEQAPEALVIATEGGPLETVTFTVTDKTWFVEAVVAVLAGFDHLPGSTVNLTPASITRFKPQLSLPAIE